MRKVSDEEENLVYDIIQQSLFNLCDQKPEEPIDFLSKFLLEFSEENNQTPNKTTKLSSKKSVFLIFISQGINTKQDEKLIISKIEDKVKLSRNQRKFKDYFKTIQKIGYGSYGSVFLAQDIKNPSKIYFKISKQTSS